jgi:hypothetical protein
LKGVQYKIRIQGLKTPEGTIPLLALKEFSENLLDSAEKALRLSVEGASVKRGKLPEWLRKSLEFTFTGISKGSTVLGINVPTLEEAAPEQIRQQDIWYTLPEPEDTAVSLLSKSISEVTSEHLESEYYDSGVIKALLSFNKILDGYATEFNLDSEDRPKEHFKIGKEELEKISQIKAKMPEPRAVVLTGLFNMIEHTKQRFKLALEDGRNIPGSVDPSLVETEYMRTLWGKKVTIKGIADFNPSGGIRFLDAQLLKPFEAGEEIFQDISELQSPLFVAEEFKTKHDIKSPLKEVWGKWPGEESIDQILATLGEISKEG